MLKQPILLCACAIFCATARILSPEAKARLSLWPFPQSVDIPHSPNQVSVGEFKLFVEGFDQHLADVAFKFLEASLLAKSTGNVHTRTAKCLPVMPIFARVLNGTVVSARDLAGADESYTLNVSSSRVDIISATKIGTIYALQTLSQLLASPDGTLPYPINIQDSPRFPYRGFLLDTSRNYFTPQDITRILNGLYATKINVFHWHIYDSQSFPIAWPRYPQMSNASYKTKKTGARKQYTQKDVSHIINVGFARNIRIIPEFDVPGHSAVFAAIDEVLVSGLWMSPWDGRNGLSANDSMGVVSWGTQYCNQPPCGQLDVRKDAAVAVYEQLVSDVGSWFMDPVLHVGHDEVNARAYGLVPEEWDHGNGDELFGLMQKFEKQLVDILEKNGKTYAAWDEVTDDSLYNISALVPKNGWITLWSKPTSTLINKIAGQGFKNIVVSPSSYYYLDCSPSAPWCLSSYEAGNPSAQYQIPGFHFGPGQWHNWTEIYSYDPLTDVSVENAEAVKGGFASLWTETVKRHNLDRYVFPRVAVVGERLWSYDAVKFNMVDTSERLNRFRTALINEFQIDAAELEYLGNGEGVVYRPELCDGDGLNADWQKTRECCFVGQSMAGVAPGGNVFLGSGGDYCAIAGLYDTDLLVPKLPDKIPYSF